MAHELGNKGFFFYVNRDMENLEAHHTPPTERAFLFLVKATLRLGATNAGLEDQAENH